MLYREKRYIEYQAGYKENDCIQLFSEEGKRGEYDRKRTPAQKVEWCTLPWRHYPGASGNFWNISLEMESH